MKLLAIICFLPLIELSDIFCYPQPPIESICLDGIKYDRYPTAWILDPSGCPELFEDRI